MAGGYGLMADDGSIDYSVHEAWNEATNVYLIVILVSFGLFIYARKNKRRIMRIFTVPPAMGTAVETSFYDEMKKVRLRQQLEMYYIDHITVAVKNTVYPGGMAMGRTKTDVPKWSSDPSYFSCGLWVYLDRATHLATTYNRRPTGTDVPEPV
uniref:Small integral membrane protein 19 n=1 Tax=Leptobrachium leishanense TaxID=445787 RepID=A0A8C5MVM3_9ANUR